MYLAWISMSQSSSIHIHSWHQVWSVWIPWVLIAYQKFQTIQLDWLCEGFIIDDLKGLLIQWKHAWRNFFGGSVFTTLLLYIICLTHFHHIQKDSPQLYGRLPMRLLKSTTEFIQPPRPLGSYYESKGSHEILWCQNSESRAMVNWTIPSALLYRPSQKIVLHYLFLSPCTPLPWWSIHLFAGFICFSSVCFRNMGAFFQIIWGFLWRSPHSFCMLFSSAGG